MSAAASQSTPDGGSERAARRAAAIVVAGGSGERFGSAVGKQLAGLAGRPVLAWSLQALLDADVFELVVVVCPAERLDDYRCSAVDPVTTSTPVVFAASGSTRQESVLNGLSKVPEDFDLIAVHDGARPLVSPELVVEVVRAASAEDVAGAIVGYASVDTLKIVEGGSVVETPDRSRFWAIQTPQVFHADVLRDAYGSAVADGFIGTDDSSLVERRGGRVALVEGPRDNIKITLPEDIAFAEAALRARGAR